MEETDAVSFTEWAAARQHALLRTAVLLTGDVHRGEDLVQDALTKVALRWSRLAAGSPEAYARKILVRDNISWWRRNQPLSMVEEPPERPAPYDGDASERRLMLQMALARLSPKQRAVIVLRFYEDLTERDTANTLGVSVGTVKSHTHDALRRLRVLAPDLSDLLGEELR